MKKIISVLLSIVMLFSVGAIGTSAAAANAEEENLCEVFDNQLSYSYFWILEGETVPYSANVIACRTYEFFPNIDDYDISSEDDPAPYYRFPADEFEALANRLFNVEVDLKTTDCWYIACEIFYNADTNTYDVDCIAGGGGDNAYYTIEGYVKNADNTYDVYLYKVVPLFSQEEVDDYLKELGTTQEEIGDKLQITEEYGETVYTISKVENAKIHVSYDGEYVKILSHEELKDIPPVEGMITPDTEVAPPDVDYDTPEGIEIEGDTAFEEGTVVKVENVASGEIYERAEKSLNEIAEDGKIAVFEFSATKDNAAVQPNGKVKVSFALPSNLSADNLKMFYVAEDGKTEEIAITVDKDTKTVVAELEHFSTYVLCNVKIVHAIDDDNSSEGSTPTSPQTGDTSNFVLFAILLFASAAVLTVLTIGKKGAYSKH